MASSTTKLGGFPVGKLWPAPARDICKGVIDEATRRAGGSLADDATVVVMKFV